MYLVASVSPSVSVHFLKRSGRSAFNLFYYLPYFFQFFQLDIFLFIFLGGDHHVGFFHVFWVLTTVKDGPFFRTDFSIRTMLKFGWKGGSEEIACSN